jgi:hypothetical protein
VTFVPPDCFALKNPALSKPPTINKTINITIITAKDLAVSLMAVRRASQGRKWLRIMSYEKESSGLYLSRVGFFYFVGGNADAMQS